MIFKPKKSVFLLIIIALVIAGLVPFLIYNQVSNGLALSRLDTSSLIMIFFNPIFFGSIALRTIYVLKTIEIDDKEVWRIRYLFPRPERVFHISDIEDVRKIDSISYKYRIPVTMFTIRLSNSKRIRISSNEMNDFEKLERLLNRKKYKNLRKI